MNTATRITSLNPLAREAASAPTTRTAAKRTLPREASLEVMLIVVILALGVLLHSMQHYRFVILNVYYLPIALAGFFLGRYRAGVMALLSVLSVSILTAIALSNPLNGGSPLLAALGVAVWGAVLGLMALLVGTLSDERFHKLSELHDAYVGVVEVLTQYLQGAHPRLKARSVRVAELSQRVGSLMKLSLAEIDDIRVGALLFDVGHIEITTRVIRRAMDTLDASTGDSHTIQGADLMLSLGSVFNGAVPLLLSQQEGRGDCGEVSAEHALLGARIIRAVRAYVGLLEGSGGQRTMSSAEVLQKLRSEGAKAYDPRVLAALEEAVYLENSFSVPPLAKPSLVKC